MDLEEHVPTDHEPGGTAAVIDDAERTAAHFEERAHANPLQKQAEALSRVILGIFSSKRQNGEVSPRQQTEALVASTLAVVLSALRARSFAADAAQQAVLRYKLIKHAQSRLEPVDPNTLADALVESPRFLGQLEGSLMKILKTHELKTLQRIAERRRARAEMTGNEAFNPYEYLFTTSSGKYALARLLNLPHLERESDFMRHCVGTSDSYLNRMKRGEVEILSLREAPHRDLATGAWAGETPVVTIEYNVRTGTVAQLKKAGDEYLSEQDPFWPDILEALGRLPATETDIGQPRRITRVAPIELQGINVPGQAVLAAVRGIVNITEYRRALDGPVLKLGSLDLPSLSRGDAASVVQELEGIVVTAEQLAFIPSQIDRETQVYIGPLEPGIFDHIQRFGIEHVYTNFPEGKIRPESLEHGGLTGKDYLDAIEIERQRRGKAGLLPLTAYDWAKQMLTHPKFEEYRQKEQTTDRFVRLTVADLGFSSEATTQEIYDRAAELGLDLCPPDVGPAWRLAHLDQSNGDYFWVAMPQVPDADGSPSVFYLCSFDDGLGLLGFDAGPGGWWDAWNQFLFRLRRPGSLSS